MLHFELDLHNPAGMDNMIPQSQAAAVEYLALTAQHEL